MFRFLFVADSPAQLCRRSLPLTGLIKRRGWTAHAMTPDATAAESGSHGFVKTFKPFWTANPLDPRRVGKAASRFRDFVERGEYDIVHLVGPSSGFLGRFALRNLRAMCFPRVIYSAGENLGGTLERLAPPWTDYLIAPTVESFHQTVARGVLPPSQIRLIADPAGRPLSESAARAWDDLYAQALNLARGNHAESNSASVYGSESAAVPSRMSAG